MVLINHQTQWINRWKFFDAELNLWELIIIIQLIIINHRIVKLNGIANGQSKKKWQITITRIFEGHNVKLQMFDLLFNGQSWASGSRLVASKAAVPGAPMLSKTRCAFRFGGAIWLRNLCNFSRLGKWHGGTHKATNRFAPLPTHRRYKKRGGLVQYVP